MTIKYYWELTLGIINMQTTEEGQDEPATCPFLIIIGWVSRKKAKTHTSISSSLRQRQKRHRYEQKQKSGEQTQISLHEPLTGFLAGAGAEV
jgi:hypothetical protein